MIDPLDSWLQRFTGSSVTGLKRPPVLRTDQIPLPQIKGLIKDLQLRCSQALLKNVPARVPRISIDDAVPLAYAPVIQPIVYLPASENSGFEKRLDPLFAERLGYYGYSDQALARIEKYCLGHASLIDAPYINSEHCGKKACIRPSLI